MDIYIYSQPSTMQLVWMWAQFIMPWYVVATLCTYVVYTPVWTAAQKVLASIQVEQPVVVFQGF